jgi:molybdopterin/thiamine biosynthesis adenylyltransferase/rhodanese-related sulfurtransferase
MELTHLRYHRQEILPGIGLEGQARLANAKVLVIGAGGLGCPALQYLAAAGVGHLGIADPDVVSLSNLHRQVLYGESDLGQMKVDVAKRRLLEINGALDIRIWPEVFGQEHCLQFINEYDVVLDATDQIASRYWISDACFLMKKILVFGAVSRFEGQVAVFKELSYRDLFPKIPTEDAVASCSIAGVLGVLPGVIGVLQATEAIKVITGVGQPLYDQLMHYQALHSTFYTLKLTPHPAATGYRPSNLEAYQTTDYTAACSPAVPLLSVEAWLQAREEFWLVDVRELEEQPRLDALGAQVMPRSQWKERWRNGYGKKVVLVCQIGARSKQAAVLLKQNNPELSVFSLEGGVQALIHNHLI